MHQGSDHWYFAIGQFGGELMLFEDRVIAPAPRAIKLGDQGLGVFDADLIDAVFVAVEGHHAGIAEKTDAFDGVEDQVGGQCFKRVGHAHSCARQAAASGHPW
ncbi:hypothetical protein D3C81_1980820 [compost metagenome]